MFWITFHQVIYTYSTRKCFTEERDNFGNNEFFESGAFKFENRMKLSSSDQ